MKALNTFHRICAQVIAAEGENKAAYALREASDIINESSSAMQLRYLQTLNSISAEKNSTIIFPFPMEFLAHFMRSSNKDGNGKQSRNGGGSSNVQQRRGGSRQTAESMKETTVPAVVPSCPSPATPSEEGDSEQ